MVRTCFDCIFCVGSEFCTQNSVAILAQAILAQVNIKVSAQVIAFSWPVPCLMHFGDTQQLRRNSASLSRTTVGLETPTAATENPTLAPPETS